jgi:hypothetical protein
MWLAIGWKQFPLYELNECIIYHAKTVTKKPKKEKKEKRKRKRQNTVI